jgi:hypothetical protein
MWNWHRLRFMLCVSFGLLGILGLCGIQLSPADDTPHLIIFNFAMYGLSGYLVKESTP